MFHNFDPSEASEADGPLALGAGKGFYGTAYGGGAYGFGSIFEITSSGAFTSLHNFDNTDGASPYGPLALGFDGNLYGTTDLGGSGSGTVFKVTPGGEFTQLFAFNGYDGAYPEGLTLGQDGYLYGTLSAGTNLSGYVYQISTAGRLTPVHDFDGSDGYLPVGVVQGVGGNLYGVATGGGANNAGTFYSLTPSGGAFAVLYTFNYEGTGGARPQAALALGNDGNFYGTTIDGGLDGTGTIFRVTPGGSLVALHNFRSEDGVGDSPQSLVQCTNGLFYGVTTFGGNNDGYGDGTVYSLDVGLPPFVETVSNFGRAGSQVEILGQGFTGATSLAFNGLPATFNVVSDTLLTAEVPVGATSGPITVATVSGILNSNRGFVVAQ